MFNFKKRPSHGFMAVRNRFIDIKKRIKEESPIVIDGGANQGSMTKLFLKQYRSPWVHAFEPIPELVKILKEKFEYNEKVRVHGVALGATSRLVSFNVVRNLVSSSVLPPTDINRFYHGEKMGIREEILVKQVRLDEQLDKEIDLLKLDLQGYELEALKGCEKLLGKIKIITIEVEFVPLYEGQPLFGEIDYFLRQRGFKLLNLYDLYTHTDGQLTAGDAVYLNSNYFRN